MSLPPSDDVSHAEQSRWFAEEVQPHEPMLRAYLRKNFPGLFDVDDVVQVSYLKLLRMKASGSLQSARGFLFVTARHVALDTFRRNRTVSLESIAESERPSIIAEEGAGPDEVASRNQELELLADAIESLPRRCRQVLKLRKIYGLSHKEIAQRLGISERTVNVQVGNGFRRCAQFLQARGVPTLDSIKRDESQPSPTDER